MSSPFFDALRSSTNLFSAWRHVRASALASSNADIRTAADEFEANIHTHLRRIQTQLRAGAYRFPRSFGVLKDKSKRERAGKRPRPIVISTLESRVVQRAILQVLQPNEKSRLYSKLGGLREVRESRFNFGGTPDGGVPRAIASVLDGLKSGHIIFYKSDIAEFFTRIPHQEVSHFISIETGDSKIGHIFEGALNIELENKDDLAEYFDLFPRGGVGVPQGSSLSALAGNILLNVFDNNLNSLTGVRCFRYIDDLLILATSNEAAQAAKNRVIDLLKQFQMKLYDPASNPDKAASGHVRKGFDYLGVSIVDTSTAPSRASKARLLAKVDQRIALAKGMIAKMARGGVPARSRERSYTQTLSDIDLVIYGWGQSYNFIENRVVFSQLDREIDSRLQRFRDYYISETSSASPQAKRRAAGLALLADTKKHPLPLI